MKLPAMIRKAASPCLLLAANAANAAVLTLSASSAYPLNAPPASLPVVSASSQLAGADMALSAAAGNSSFAAGHTLDNMSLSPAASESTLFSSAPTYVTDAADDFATYQDLKWEVKLKLRQTYTSVRSLFSMIDIGEGDAQEAGKLTPSQLQEVSKAGAHARSAAGAIASDASTLCVAANGSYNTIGAATQKDCPAGSIFVSTQRSASMAEYAAYSQSMSKYGNASASVATPYSADFRYSRNESSPRQYRHCGECDDDQGEVLDPGLLLRLLRWIQEPTSLLLLVVLAVVASLISDAAGKGRRA